MTKKKGSLEILICRNCNNNFEHISRAKIYCSVMCREDFWLRNYKEIGKGIIVKRTCQDCKKEIIVDKERDKHWRRVFQNRFCIDCRQKPENTGAWKGGRIIDKRGYVLVYVKNKEGKKKHEWEHRLVAEKALGRKLKKDEMVHHVNGNKADNRNSNLLICDRHYHKWLHNYMSDLYIQEKFNTPEFIMDVPYPC